MRLFVENTRTIKAYGRIKNNEKASKLKILKFQSIKKRRPHHGPAFYNYLSFILLKYRENHQFDRKKCRTDSRSQCIGFCTNYC